MSSAMSPVTSRRQDGRSLISYLHTLKRKASLNSQELQPRERQARSVSELLQLESSSPGR
ncbi:unnamed protein product, partial [Nesidiocoris tenuis]